MVHRRKLIILFLFLWLHTSCLHTATCLENLSYNLDTVFENFKIINIYRKTRGELIIENYETEKILIKEEFGILLHRYLLKNDIISKRKNENIILVKRGNYTINYSMICNHDNSVMLIDTVNFSR